MRKQILFIFFIVVGFNINVTQAVSEKQLRRELRLCSFFLDSVVNDYYSSGLIGNGLLGASVYKEKGDTLCWELGRVDVVDHRTENFPLLYKNNRLPIGKFLIPMNGGKSTLLTDYSVAEVSGIVSGSTGSFTWRTLTPACHRVYIIEMKGENLPSISFRPEMSVSPRYLFANGKRKLWDKGIEDYKPNPPAFLYTEGDYYVCKQPMLAGGEYTTVWTIKKTKNKQVLIASVAYSQTRTDTEKEAIKDIENVLAVSLNGVENIHRKWWKDFYSKSYVSVDEDRYNRLFWSQLYKLGSATRSDGYVIDLMGPWYHNNTPWCAIWWNLNIQLTYSPLFGVNHCELSVPLFDMLDREIKNLQKNATSGKYPAVAIGRTSAYDCLSSVGREHGLLIWTLFYYWKYCNYTQNEIRWKDKLFPLLKLAVNHYRNMMFVGDDGYLHLPKSHSPEYADAEDCNFELALLRWGCKILIDSDKKFGINDELLPEWKRILDELVPYPRDENGFLIGKGVKLTSGHRHYSHLLMIYPLGNFTSDTPENLDIINRSIDYWLGFKTNSYYRGYTYTGASSMMTIQGNGERAYSYLNIFLDKFFRPNTLYGEDGPCFETPMSALAAYTEMLLSSNAGLIRIMPAVPSCWKDIRYERLLAENGFEVSAYKKDGVIQEVHIKSLYGGRCKIDVDIPEDFRKIKADSGVIFESGKMISIVMPKGKTISIYNVLK